MRTIPGRRDFVQALALAALPALASSRALAQEASYPNHAVKLIVPNAPGSSVDTIGRRAGGRAGSRPGAKFLSITRPAPPVRWASMPAGFRRPTATR